MKNLFIPHWGNVDGNSRRTLFAEAAHETCAAGAQSGDVVAVASVPALAHLGAFLPEEAQRATCTAWKLGIRQIRAKCGLQCHYFCVYHV